MMLKISASKTIFLDTVDSTNDEAKRRLTDLTEPTWIVASEQLKGKGRQGKIWFDGKKNFSGSLVFFPQDIPGNFFLYGFFMGVALYNTIQDLLEDTQDLFLKWPNDIILKGKKISGILIESQKLYSSDNFALIIGIGVNLNTAPTLDKNHKEKYETICLADYLGSNVDEEKFFQSLRLKIANLEKGIKKNELEKIVDFWLERTYELGTTLEMRNNKGKYVTGEFLGLDQTGGILISTENEVVKIYSGDVFFRN